MVLGGHSVSSSFRLRKKRGSFRLKRVPTLADVVPLPMKYMPLSYFDTYYALGNARARRLENGLSDDIYLGSSSNMLQEEPTMEDEKRASFRLKKIPEDAADRLEPFEKRASFRLKRILDSYKDLLGPPSSGNNGDDILLKYFILKAPFTNFIILSFCFYQIRLLSDIGVSTKKTRWNFIFQTQTRS